MLAGSSIRYACLTVHVTSVIFSASVNCPSLPNKETAMEQSLRCPLCGHKLCNECSKGLWLTCCRCRVRVGTCKYCWHIRCEECDPDRWSSLDDGCCVCRSRILQRLATK